MNHGSFPSLCLILIVRFECSRHGVCTLALYSSVVTFSVIYTFTGKRRPTWLAAPSCSCASPRWFLSRLRLPRRRLSVALGPDRDGNLELDGTATTPRFRMSKGVSVCVATSGAEIRCEDALGATSAAEARLARSTRPDRGSDSNRGRHSQASCAPRCGRVTCTSHATLPTA